jgi:hypothetical protein
MAIQAMFFDVVRWRDGFGEVLEIFGRCGTE